MAVEARLACGGLALGLALVAIALFEGRDWSDEPTDGAEDERTRHLNLDNATITTGGRAVRLWFATSRSYVPCGFTAGDNGRVIVFELRATNPRVALADLNGRCVDAVLDLPLRGIFR
jgi:hypothetical protein